MARVPASERTRNELKTSSPEPMLSYLFARNSLLTTRLYCGRFGLCLRLLLKCLTLEARSV